MKKHAWGSKRRFACAFVPPEKVKGIPTSRQYVERGNQQVKRTDAMPPPALGPVVHYLRRIDTDARQHADTDADLLERFVRRGDEAAFATLLKRYGPMVFGVCRRILRDAHEAEDAFQATFL